MLKPDALRWKPTGRTERWLCRHQKRKAPRSVGGEISGGLAEGRCGSR
jgi:hypothetical protein